MIKLYHTALRCITIRMDHSSIFSDSFSFFYANIFIKITLIFDLMRVMWTTAISCLEPGYINLCHYFHRFLMFLFLLIVSFRHLLVWNKWKLKAPFTRLYLLWSFGSVKAGVMWTIAMSCVEPGYITYFHYSLHSYIIFQKINMWWYQSVHFALPYCPSAFVCDACTFLLY